MKTQGVSGELKPKIKLLIFTFFCFVFGLFVQSDIRGFFGGILGIFCFFSFFALPCLFVVHSMDFIKAIESKVFNRKVLLLFSGVGVLFSLFGFLIVAAGCLTLLQRPGFP